MVWANTMVTRFDFNLCLFLTVLFVKQILSFSDVVFMLYFRVSFNEFCMCVGVYMLMFTFCI